MLCAVLPFFREWRLTREREVIQLRRNAQRQNAALQQHQAMHSKQQVRMESLCLCRLDKHLLCFLLLKQLALIARYRVLTHGSSIQDIGLQTVGVCDRLMPCVCCRLC
jgi:hypothetical protein